MANLIKKLGLWILIFLFAWTGTLLADRELLSNDVIRVFVTGNSQRVYDGKIQESIGDTVTEYIQEHVGYVDTWNQQSNWLCGYENELEMKLNEVLDSAGCHYGVTIDFSPMRCSTGRSESMMIPAGIYQTVQIVLGEGKGDTRSYWPYTGELTGEIPTSEWLLPKDLLDEMTGSEEVKIRLFLLDCLGKIQNFLFTDGIDPVNWTESVV